MKKWNLIIDVDNCTNCNMCTLASKDEHVGNAFPGYSAEMPKRGAEWIKIEKKENSLQFKKQVPTEDPDSENLLDFI